MLHEFNFSTDERFVSIDDVPDLRSDADKVFTPLSVFNHAKPDLGYAERLAEETINIVGAWVLILPRTDNADVNEVWEEDPNPSYKNGIRLKGYFKPEPTGLELTKWGVDAPNQTTIVFARSTILQQFGQKRMLRPGDVISIPHNALGQVRINKFRIVDAQDSGNFHYRWLYYQALLENIIDDKSLNVDHK
jgi:hypothetical protein